MPEKCEEKVDTAGPAAWGSEVAQYTQWALCTPALEVENVQAFWWGAIPIADADPWFSMIDSEFSATPLGTAYLGEVEALTSQGCPVVAATAAQAATHPAAPGSTRKQPARKKVKRAGKRVKASRHHKPRPRPPHKPARRRRNRSRSAKRR